VGSIACESIETIGDGEDPSDEWDGLTFETGRVAATVIPFVMVKDDRQGLLKEFDVFENSTPPPRMLVHQTSLFCREGAGFRQDRIWDTNLADVVKHCAAPKGL